MENLALFALPKVDDDYSTGDESDGQEEQNLVLSDEEHDVVNHAEVEDKDDDYEASPRSQKAAEDIESLSKLPSTISRAAKISRLLQELKEIDRIGPDLEVLLYNHVVTLNIQAQVKDCNYDVIKVLLSAGADINAHTAASLCLAVKAADLRLTDIFLATKPTPDSLAAALRHSLNLPTPADRLNFTRRLIEAGAPGSELNRALRYALLQHPNDRELIKLLSAHADTTDGTALKFAIDQEDTQTVELLTTKKKGKYTSGEREESEGHVKGGIEV